MLAVVGTCVVLALCGGAGAVARQFLMDCTKQAKLPAFGNMSVGMLCVNCLGCVLAAAAPLILRACALDPNYGFYVSVGILGGFTSFSTPCAETAILCERKQYGRALAYAVCMLACCFAIYLICMLWLMRI